jgi:hypothetical protein
MKFAGRHRQNSRRSRSEGGYAILLVLFLATLVLLSTMVVAPNILTEGRREKEKEMIWRGKQYTRAIKFYYRKTGKFPTSMDDLTKPHVGNVRFMRQAYKDPMNAKEGEWRLIYVGPQGQLIGSLKPQQNIQLGGLGSAPVPGTPAAQVAAQSAGQGFSDAGGTPPETSQGSNPGTGGQPSSTGTPATTNPSSDATGDPSSTDSASEALLATDPSTIMGGNIIGVGSKINRRSIMVYDKARNYKQFEFIWDPSKDRIAVGSAPGPQIGTPVGSPLGSPAGSNPQPTPPETAAPPQ